MPSGNTAGSRLLLVGFLVRFLLAGALSILVAACASHRAADVPAPPPQKPIAQVLQEFASAHGNRDAGGVLRHTAQGAVLKSPAMPRRGPVQKYLSAMLAEPFTMQVSNTEVLYANELGAKTRSRVRLTAPARFAIDDRLEVLWKIEDGQWKIFEIDYPEWPPFVGTWRKASLAREESLELRLLPGGHYLVYAERDRTIPSFRGSYTSASGTITLTDTSASIASNLSPEEGRYAVVVSGSQADLRKISDAHRWRSERFGGIWSAGD